MQVDKGSRKAQTAAVRVGAAVRSARVGKTQTQLAKAVGTDQPTISKWERGTQLPTVDEIAAVERATGRTPGWVLIRAGYVSATPGVEDAIAADKRLTDDQRTHLVWAYRAAVAESKRRR